MVKPHMLSITPSLSSWLHMLKEISPDHICEEKSSDKLYPRIVDDFLFQLEMPLAPHAEEELVPDVLRRVHPHPVRQQRVREHGVTGREQHLRGFTDVRFVDVSFSS